VDFSKPKLFALRASSLMSDDMVFARVLFSTPGTCRRGLFVDRTQMSIQVPGLLEFLATSFEAAPVMFLFFMFPCIG